MNGNWTVAALLSLAVAAAWIACWGYLRPRGRFDTLHHPCFIAAGTGSAMALAGLFAEGLTERVGKLMLLDALALVSGLVLAHALARSAARRHARRAGLPVGPLE
jgi:hypothetical protein